MMDVQTAVAIATIIISLAAVVISVITWRSQVKHDRNSVRPIINIELGDYENEIYVKLTNVGVGPATIERVSCVKRKNGMRVREHENLISYFRKLVFEWEDFTDDFRGKTIAPGGEMYLLLARKFSEDEAISIRSVLKKIVVAVEYKDIYGEDMERAKRSLGWFGRTLGDGDEQVRNSEERRSAHTRRGAEV